jgi:hypothetical protein
VSLLKQIQLVTLLRPLVGNSSLYLQSRATPGISARFLISVKENWLLVLKNSSRSSFLVLGSNGKIYLARREKNRSPYVDSRVYRKTVTKRQRGALRICCDSDQLCSSRN